MPITVAITLPFPAPPGLADELSEDLGVYPHLEDKARGVDPPAAGIVVATALGFFVSGMIQQFGAEAASHLMRGLGRLRRANHQTIDQDILLIDEANDIVIVLDPRAVADDRAMKALIAQERDVFLPGVELRWNPVAGRWQARRIQSTRPL